MPLDGKQWMARDVAKLLWDNGWVNAENLMIMVAVLQAESALFEKAWNFNPPTNTFPKGSYDRGIFQLNDQGKQGQAQIDFMNMAYDPLKAVKVARPMYEQRSFQPWYAYKNGAWEKFIPQATIAVCNMLRVKFGVKPL